MTDLFAHGIASGTDIPIPLTLALAAAAVVLTLSFVTLAFGWTSPRLGTVARTPIAVPAALELLAGATGLTLFAAVVYAGLVGTSLPNENLAPTAVYVGFWVGLSLASLLLGDVFHALSPWRAAGRAIGWLVARVGLDEPPKPYPERVGRSPAAVGLFAFTICELCWARAGEPGPLAVLMLVYFLVMLVGMSVYGVEPWVRNADAFGVLFSLLAALAPGRRLAGATSVVPVAGTVSLLIVAIGSTAFDGAQETRTFQWLEDVGTAAGMPADVALEVGRVAGLAIAIGIVVGIWFAGIFLIRRHARAFAHTLIPIAAGYLVAHYFSLAVFGGQALWPLANDPLGQGADLFGGAAASVDYAALSATTIWWVQVGALVLGHVAALVLAHDRALEVYGSARAAARSQLAMLGLMVVFTCMGLWLLSTGFQT